VSIASERPDHTSIQNLLPCIIESIAADTHPSQALVRVKCGKALLLARLTRRAVATLDLQVGKPVWAQVKSVALVE
jgi:molybdate transport system ATP-binding protein